ncbi:ATP synthase F1 subunit delta [Flavobacterium urocaniciphilum]|uniref:ATP synthase subunit delta n=1 Tax=Flavobacterium urocaniciphilum TaxID=1299341 RepID=A0A1H9A972_9FLAO|nr:ATP synthase F1 subunit delta [Flavobacterium urocaniciphilum]SEP73282.1 ATP synthase F1 subcomplex delta subunit [Flavobacterium urocaniciphilum]
MSRAAIRYAKAILDIASVNNNTVAVNNDMKSIVLATKESTELKEFFANPIVSENVKLNAVKEIFSSVQNETNGLFQLLLANKRFEILPAIAAQFNTLFDVASGVETAVVTTAIPMSAELETQVMSKLKEFSSNTITIKNVVDESIIGGFVIRIGDKQYNASVANKLQQLKREFTTN